MTITKKQKGCSFSIDIIDHMKKEKNISQLLENLYMKHRNLERIPLENRIISKEDVVI